MAKQNKTRVETNDTPAQVDNTPAPLTPAQMAESLRAQLAALDAQRAELHALESKARTEAALARDTTTADALCEWLTAHISSRTSDTPPGPWIATLADHVRINAVITGHGGGRSNTHARSATAGATVLSAIGTNVNGAQYPHKHNEGPLPEGCLRVGAYDYGPNVKGGSWTASPKAIEVLTTLRAVGAVDGQYASATSSHLARVAAAPGYGWLVRGMNGRGEVFSLTATGLAYLDSLAAPAPTAAAITS